MIRFRFKLRPVQDIQPWGTVPRLHWFALTDGHYWIETDEYELLRYSDQTIHQWTELDAGEVPQPYVDYFVVRLWEDILEIFAEATESVPADLLDFVAADLAPDLSFDEITPQAEAAATWHGGHSFNLGYLQNAPHMRWWRGIVDGRDVVNLAWRNRPDSYIEFAGPETGCVSIPVSSFVEAVTEFDKALLAAMEQRVKELEVAGPPAGVALDLQHLRREQGDRATWFQRARTRELTTDWDSIREGARQLLKQGTTGTAFG